VLKYKDSNTCEETIYVNKDCTFKKFDYIDTDDDGKGDIMLITSPSQYVYICLS
jgi:hypothetical protein